MFSEDLAFLSTVLVVLLIKPALKTVNNLVVKNTGSGVRHTWIFEPKLSHLLDERLGESYLYCLGFHFLICKAKKIKVSMA
jgi:hypothetical protein